MDSGQRDGGLQFETLTQEPAWLGEALQICAAPLRLSEALARELLDRFSPGVDTKEFRSTIDARGLMVEGGGDAWRLDREVRRYFLAKLEEEQPELAKAVHAAVLEDLETADYPATDEDQMGLLRAYHTTPSAPEEGGGLYWSLYCRARVKNYTAFLPVIASLAESQLNWLGAYEDHLGLYRAAALYYEGGEEKRARAAALLEEIVTGEGSAPILIDASYLLGTLREQSDRQEALELYKQAISYGGRLNFPDGQAAMNAHLRLSLAKSYFNAASIFQFRGDLEEAEIYYRHGMQIAIEEKKYEAAMLHELIGVMRRRGKTETLVGPIRRMQQIEDPFRKPILEQAQSSPRDNNDHYYTVSSLKHGLGYEFQYIRVEIEKDGSTRLEGTYKLYATTMMGSVDTYLETVPDSQVGVHFESVESLTDGYMLTFRKISIDEPEAERLEIVIDPPMQPGDELTYRWTARSDAGTMATTVEQLAGSGRNYEYVYWDVIAPMKLLEMEVLIPAEEGAIPPSWIDLWRVGRWQGTQMQTAYRASLEDDPSRVRWHAEIRPPDKVRLSLGVDYPWLAMRYVLAWVVN